MPKEPVSIAETVVYGVAFDPKNSERLANMDLNDLSDSVGRLFDLLEERRVEYVLAGGIAMLSYIEGRNTQDIDLVMKQADLDRLPELRVDERNERFASSWLGELRIDLLFADNEPFKTVMNRYTGKRIFAERVVPCATETGMLWMKLYALPSLYRQGQFDRVDVYRSDLTGLIRRGAKPSDSLWRMLSKEMIESDVDELRKIVAEIELQITEGTQRFGPGAESE